VKEGEEFTWESLLFQVYSPFAAAVLDNQQMQLLE
jgi:hypothetical protein